jgi:hypothetical protein
MAGGYSQVFVNNYPLGMTNPDYSHNKAIVAFITGFIMTKSTAGGTFDL